MIHVGDIMSTSGCSVHRRDIMSRLKDVMSASKEYSEEYHKYIGRISWGNYNW